MPDLEVGNRVFLHHNFNNCAISEAGIHSDIKGERSLCDSRPAGRGDPLPLLDQPRGDFRATPLNAFRGQEQATQDAQ